MSVRESQFLEALDRSGRGLRVTFVWHRDRFAHTITAVDKQRVAPLLASEEGTDEDDWPPSPPLQSLSVEERENGRQVALLVGMAGTTHWSFSIEADPRERSLTFDVACRIKTAPRQLGSKYRTMVAPSLDESRGSAALDERCVLKIETIRGEQPALLSASQSGLSLDVQPRALQLPATVRWRYCVTCD